MDVFSDLLGRPGLWQSINAVLITGATILLVAFTGRYVKLTRALALDAEARSQPSVYLDIELHGHDDAILVVGNAGPSPAREIKMRVVKENIDWIMAEERGLANHPVVQNGLSYLAPGRRMRYWLGAFDWAAAEDGCSHAEMTVDYATPGGQELSANFKIDLKAYLGSHLPTLQEPLERLAESGRNIESHFFRHESKAEAREMARSLGTAKKPCPSCREMIFESANKCPHCREFLKKRPSVLQNLFELLKRVIIPCEKRDRG